MVSGQWMWGPDGRKWHFESGSLALDYGYTGDYGYGRPEWERLHGPSELQAWIKARYGVLDRPISPEQFTEALRFRGAVVDLAHAAADGREHPPQSIDQVNEVASAAPIRPFLAGGTTPPGPLTLRAVLSTVAGNAVEVFSSAGGRVRRCAGEDCALIYFDHSRPNSRRWCSMARCGNRAKVRAHRGLEER